jgi:hypothetical protein
MSNANMSEAELDKLIKERYRSMPGKSGPEGRPQKPKVLYTRNRKVKIPKTQC